MLPVLLLLGLGASVFVGLNIGGASTGIAWGPAVGARLVKKTVAAGLMTLFVFLGGWTVGRNVIETLARDLVTVQVPLEAGVAVLFFIGLGMLAGNLLSVPISTTMTTVGGLAGLGLATGTLDYATVGRIVSWWILSPFIGFFAGLIIGRHLYPALARRFRLVASEGDLLRVDREAGLPRVRLGPNTTRREVGGHAAVIAIGCYMAFSAGASNVPNAVAPLVSSGAIGTDAAILVATAAIGVGAFTLARRTMESVGTELTDLSLFASLIVLVTAATISTALSYLGIPIAVTIIMVMTIAGLGWGRATRPISLEAAVGGSLEGQIDEEIALGAVTLPPGGPSSDIGEPEPRAVLEQASDLFDRRALARYVSMWIVSASVSFALSYGFFLITPFVG